MKLMAFVDESGIITKSKETAKSREFFTIALIFTNNSDKVKRIFRKEVAKLMRKDRKLLNLFEQNHEIKANDISEKKKTILYQKLVDKCKDCLEIGIIALDNVNIQDNFRDVKARSFNFLIKDFLVNSFSKHSKFKGKDKLLDSLDFIIDEQNVSTKCNFDLEEYLNIVALEHPICKKDIKVKYVDSSTSYLVQLADFVANTAFRDFSHKQPKASSNLGLLKELICGGFIYRFPVSTTKNLINSI